nr:synaptobrevin, longin-like domain protein [Tanacetum cinerariifolium]
MAALQYKAEHNKVGYLLKPTGSDDYHNIIDFLRSSHIRYALTANPIIFDSLVKQFWSTATLRAPELGPPAILATTDRTPYVITKDLVRSSLQLADDGGVTDLPISEIYSGMDALGYVTEGKLTFFKNKFSPQWRFLVHTLLHYLSPKSGSWDQFGSPIAIALICFSDGRRFNWSNYIFKGMVNNIGNAKKFLIKLFANMRLNFAGNPMLLLPAMLLQEQADEGAEVAAQDAPHPLHAPDQSSPHLTTPSRPQSPDPVAPVLEHDHSSTHPETVAGSFPSTEDAPLGGNFHTSPPRSSYTPPTGQPSGGAEDPITLTALSSVVSTLVQKVHSLEAELHDHKKLFKDVVGKLVKKVKSLEVKMKTKKRKMVVSDSDEEDGTTPNVDLDALRALANVAVAVDSDVPLGGTSHIPTASPDTPTNVPAVTSTTPGASGASSVAPGASSIALGASSVAPDASGVAPGDFDVSPSVSVPPTTTSAVPAATSTVPADNPIVPTVVSTDNPNVLASASNKGKSLMIEEEIPIPAKTFRQMEEDRLGDDVSEDNFPARMAALIKKKRQALDEQLFKKRHNRPLTPAQQKAYIQTLKRPGSMLEEPPTKKPKSPEAPTQSMPEIPISPTVASPPSSRTRRKSLGQKHMHKPKSTLPTLDLDAPAQAFLKVIVDEDSDDEDSIDETKLDNHLVQTEKGRLSSKNLFRLIDSSMSVRTNVGLGFNNYIRENELGWDDSAFSVFTTNSKDVEGRPLFNRFAKTDSKKVVPLPLSGDYTSLSDHIDLDESQMFYGTKSSTSSDSKSMSNDFVSCDDSDESSEVNTNNFTSSDSSVKSSEPKPNDSTSCASTSSVSTSEN